MSTVAVRSNCTQGIAQTSAATRADRTSDVVGRPLRARSRAAGIDRVRAVEGSACLLDQAELARAGYGAGARGDSELASDALRMRADSVERYVQLRGYLAVAEITSE